MIADVDAMRRWNCRDLTRSLHMWMVAILHGTVALPNTLVVQVQRSVRCSSWPYQDQVRMSISQIKVQVIEWNEHSFFVCGCTLRGDYTFWIARRQQQTEGVHVNRNQWVSWDSNGKGNRNVARNGSGNGMGINVMGMGVAVSQWHPHSNHISVFVHLRNFCQLHLLYTSIWLYGYNCQFVIK